jgi:hypothetical protein
MVRTIDCNFRMPNGVFAKYNAKEEAKKDFKKIQKEWKREKLQEQGFKTRSEKKALDAGLVNDDGTGNATAYNHKVRIKAAIQKGFIKNEQDPDDVKAGLTAYNRKVRIKAAIQKGFIKNEQDPHDVKAGLRAYRKELRVRPVINEGEEADNPDLKALDRHNYHKRKIQEAATQEANPSIKDYTSDNKNQRTKKLKRLNLVGK